MKGYWKLVSLLGVMPILCFWGWILLFKEVTFLHQFPVIFYVGLFLSFFLGLFLAVYVFSLVDSDAREERVEAKQRRKEKRRSAKITKEWLRSYVEPLKETDPFMYNHYMSERYLWEINAKYWHKRRKDTNI